MKTITDAKNYDLQVQNNSLLHENDILSSKNKILTNDVESLQRELTIDIGKYNLLDFPSVPLKDIEVKIKMMDRLITDTIIEYLRLDSYELVKNLASCTNSQNASEIIAYRDGALGRNEGLIQRLS